MFSVFLQTVNLLYSSLKRFTWFFFPILPCRNSWEELLEITRLRGERLRDAEAIHKCYQDLTDALAHIEVKNDGKVSYNANFISA